MTSLLPIPGFISPAPGVFQRAEPASSTTPEIRESYATRAQRILQADLPHYQGLFPKLLPLLRQLPRCNDIVAWGGGHPKLESFILRELPYLFEVPEVLVVDAAANDYQATDEAFQALYGPVPVTYYNVDEIEIMDLSELNSGPFSLLPSPLSGPPPLNTFIHFLEHLPTWDTVLRFIAACNGSPILIYGPNVAMGGYPEWCHYQPADHNVFWLPSILDRHLRTLYPNVHTLTHSDDLFHLAW